MESKPSSVLHGCHVETTRMVDDLQGQADIVLIAEYEQ